MASRESTEAPNDDRSTRQGTQTSETSTDPHTVLGETIPPVSQRMPSRTELDDLRKSRANSQQRIADDGGVHRASILNDEMFGERYNYGMAEAAGASNPINFATAVGRDVGSLFFGALGFGPKPEKNEAMCAQSHCPIRQGNLKKQADEIERKRLEEEATRQQSSDEEPSKTHQNNMKGLTGGNSGSDLSSETPTSPDGKAGKDEEHFNIARDSTSSVASGDITVTGTGHYNPKNDVILRLETMSPNETRFLNALMWVWLTVAFVFLVYNFARKLENGDGAVQNYNQAYINVVLGTICLAVISLVCVTHAMRIIYNVRQKKVWKPRRRKSVTLTAVELFIQWCNLLFFVLPNYEVLGPRCFSLINNQHITYFSFARWTCWNSFFLISLIQAHNTNIVSVKRSEASDSSQSLKRSSSLKQQPETHYKDENVNDLPFLKMHWWKLVLWGLMEASVIACCVYYGETVNHPVVAPHPVRQDCGDIKEFTCRVSNTSLGLVSIMVFFALIYFALYCYFIVKAFHQLKQKSSTEFRIANMIVRLQVRLRLPAFSLFTLSLILLWYVKPFSCTSLFDTWFGMLPGQLATSGCVLLTMFVTTPKMIAAKERPPLLQVWLQEFCWTEEEKKRKMDRRNQTMAPEERHTIEKEPMFCVETMMKCLYWSLLIYDFDEVDDSRLSLDEGCALFCPPLDSYELFWEKSLDTKLLLAWSRKRIVLSFRGTASLANVMADLQAWRVPHQPSRGPFWRRPKVHSGFDKAWRNNKLDEKVMQKIESLFLEKHVDKDDVEIVVTGHSLGGALATLASYSVMKLGEKYGCVPNLTCVTFGAPRTGNTAFAQEFEKTVPNCWHIINDQDVVARGAKFLVLYKRGGHRVLINSVGDMICRPNPMEAAMRLVPCSGSVSQHLLTSYMQSLLSVLLAQFSYKRLSGGMTGVVALVKNSVPIKRILMEEAGLELKDLLYMTRWGQYAPRVADVAKLPITGRRSGAVTRDLNDKQADDSKGKTTRGGFFCGCCRPISVKVKEAKSQRPKNAMDSKNPEDANLRDGGDTQKNLKAETRLDDQETAQEPVTDSKV